MFTFLYYVMKMSTVLLRKHYNRQKLQ
jgi:hypothetical protein